MVGRALRCIIAGGRDIADEHLVYNAIVRSGFMYEIAEVVCGGAKGGDDFGDKFAFDVGLPVRYFIVTENFGWFDFDRLRSKRVKDEMYENVTVMGDWQRDGGKAGPIRNAAMADYADALIAVWDGTSTGTRGMIALARERGLRVHVERIDGERKETAERGHPHVAQHEKATHRPALPQKAASQRPTPRQDRATNAQ